MRRNGSSLGFDGGLYFLSLITRLVIGSLPHHTYLAHRRCRALEANQGTKQIGHRRGVGTDCETNMQLEPTASAASNLRVFEAYIGEIWGPEFKSFVGDDWNIYVKTQCII